MERQWAWTCLERAPAKMKISGRAGQIITQNREGKTSNSYTISAPLTSTSLSELAELDELEDDSVLELARSRHFFTGFTCPPHLDFLFALHHKTSRLKMFRKVSLILENIVFILVFAIKQKNGSIWISSLGILVLEFFLQKLKAHSRQMA